MNKKAFTLLELLVVVIIIGILAAIALPQYQMAVGKAKYAELKENTRIITEALQRYYLINSTYNATADKLDITIPSTIYCEFYIGESRVKCYKHIFGKEMAFYRNKYTGRPQLCLTYSTDTKDRSNRLCQQETGKKNWDCNNSQGWCQYFY